jgi:hypothetical protein
MRFVVQCQGRSPEAATFYGGGLCSGISKACVSSPKGRIHTMEFQGEKIG